MTKGELILSGIVCIIAILVFIHAQISRRNKNRLWKALCDLKREEAETKYPINYTMPKLTKQL